MPKPRSVLSLAAALALVPVVPAVAEAGPVWQRCSAVARDWDAADDRTECTTVPVPVDYADPGGRTIDIAVSRVRATGERTGVVLTNPGGPGQPGVRTPVHLAESRAAGIGVHHDLIGFDPRGTGYSTRVDCPSAETEPDPALSEEEQARRDAESVAAANRRCFDADPALVRSFTTATVARDMDRVRVALGERRIGYYGVSWGTGLGAQYRTLFDGNVDGMLLDSVMPPHLDVTAMDDGQAAAGENTFHEFAAWIARYDAVYHFGVAEPTVSGALLDLRAELTARPRTAPDGTVVDGRTVTMMLANPRREWAGLAANLAVLRDGGTATAAAGPAVGAFGWDADPFAFTVFAQTAFLCNESPSPRDFETVWRHRLDRVARFPVVGEFSLYEKRCVGWPEPARPWVFQPGTSPLQLVGHTYEPVTPVGWAVAMRERIGGTLMTVEDDAHGSLADLPCAAAAVEFFDTGRASAASCAGPPIPAP